MAIEHDSITDPEIHEPKGISTAAVDTVYVADGAGSGAWMPMQSYIGAYIAFDASTPAYQHTTTTSDTILNPIFNISESKNFSGATSPNARLIYTGTDDVVANMNLIISPKNASGTQRDVQWAIFKNGTEVAGTRCIRSITSGTWASVALGNLISLSTNDYIEIKTKADASCTIDYAGAFFTISAHPKN